MEMRKALLAGVMLAFAAAGPVWAQQDTANQAGGVPGATAKPGTEAGCPPKTTQAGQGQASNAPANC